ncbi:hypothetical protein H6H02_10625 [Coleofasciculus sp. FACHB-1120]|nr:hypothetical protein [Coleofasciculus sp. FACHB-1120]
MFQLLFVLVHAIQPVLVPLCFLCAWMLLLLIGWSLFSTISTSFTKAKQMHSVPCSNCRYFTGDYRLKCTVQPSIAQTEEAIDCSDYRPIPGFSFHSQDTI